MKKKVLFLMEVMLLLICVNVYAGTPNEDAGIPELEVNKIYYAKGETEFMVPYQSTYLRIYFTNMDDIIGEGFGISANTYEPECQDCLYEPVAGVADYWRDGYKAVLDWFKYDEEKGQYYIEVSKKNSENFFYHCDYVSRQETDRDYFYTFGVESADGKENVSFGYYITYDITSEIDKVSATKTTDYLPVYRMYNRLTGEHLYTTDDYEVRVLFKSQGWGYEGTAWYSAGTGTPVYRLYNAKLGNHLYTTDTHEVEVLTTTEGWTADFDGAPVMYSSGDVNIYRLYNQPLNGMHHWTTDQNEYNVLPSQGWTQENIGFKALSVGIPRTTTYNE